MSKQNQKSKNKENAKKRIDPLILVSAIACFVAVVAMVVVIGIKFTPKKGEFVPPPFDSAAVVGTPEVPDGLGWSELNAEDIFFVSACGEVKLNDGKADVWLTNPEKNTVWLKLRVLNEQGEILAETGLIRPGEYLQTVHFDILPEIGDQITMKIMAYEPDTYVSAGAVSLKTVIS